MTDSACSRVAPPSTWLALSVVLSACVALSATAQAQQASALSAPTPTSVPGASAVRLELALGATVPIDLHVGARVVVLERFYLGASLGAGVYGDAYTGITSATMGDAVAQVVTPLARNPLVATLSAGVRPFGDGLELAFGYTLLHASASYDPSTFTSALPLALAVPSGVTAVGLDVTLHAVHAELAYTFVIADHFLIRPAIGWTQTLASTVSVSTTPTIADAHVAAMLATAGQTIATALPQYAMTPTISLELGYRF